MQCKNFLGVSDRERLSINNLTFHLKELEKAERRNPGASGRKGTAEVTVGAGHRENRATTEKRI